jgi:hypothetical protein
MSTNPLNSYFSGISGGTKSVITQALANAVLAELGKPNLDTIAGVEKMIWDEHEAQIVQDATGLSIISKIKVHCRNPMKWTPATGEEMRTLFSHKQARDMGSNGCVDLCPTTNPGVWMKFKIRQEFENFNNKNPA